MHIFLQNTFPSFLINYQIKENLRIFQSRLLSSKSIRRKVTETPKTIIDHISIIPVISKKFENVLCKQLTLFIDKHLSEFQCGFRKRYSSQYCLLAMLEKQKKAADNRKVFKAFLTDLSKAFDCLPHELITVKINADGLSFHSSKLINSYL